MRAFLVPVLVAFLLVASTAALVAFRGGAREPREFAPLMGLAALAVGALGGLAGVGGGGGRDFRAQYAQSTSAASGAERARRAFADVAASHRFALGALLVAAALFALALVLGAA